MRKIVTDSGGLYFTKENDIWSAQIFSTEIGCKFAQKNILVINRTWMTDIPASIIEQWLNADTKNKVVFYSAYDPEPPFDVHYALESLDIAIDFSRIKYITSGDFSFYLLAVDRFFLEYNIQDITPREFKYKFLCYQRKPSTSRTELYESLKDKAGIVTIGDKKFPVINNNIPDHVGHTEAGGALEVTNDIWSLGNIEIWNSSLLNIVSETGQDLGTLAPFVSEKAFKPMVGLRPFICFGHPKTSDYLRNLGFETFDDEFGYRPTDSVQDNIRQITNIVDNLDVSVYNTLMPKLTHNKNWIPRAAQNEWKKIELLVQELCE